MGLSLGGGKGGGGYWCESDWCGGGDSGLVDDIISKTFALNWTAILLPVVKGFFWGGHHHFISAIMQSLKTVDVTTNI